eukprot:TRINITY_DN23688_c0_g2_i1.p1 TRINITY_DN23688_c0_g2~~TRINITY_DN23688_c0_g2_i1.p1  ORF type:complete len:984 (-),score=125.82 TRINITY_DN23688_c0_g2_i1:205-3093(-)
MPLEGYRLRHRRTHAASACASAIAILATAVFVLGRAHSGRRPTPRLQDATSDAIVDEACGCNCNATHGNLFCAPFLGDAANGSGGAAGRNLWQSSAAHANADQRDAPHSRMPLVQWAPGTESLQGCLQALPDVFLSHGPVGTVESCSCGTAGADVETPALPGSYSCLLSYSFSDKHRGNANFASMIHLMVALLVLIWDLHYLFIIYYRVIPSAPEDDINCDWFLRWVCQHRDVLHCLAVWTIWGQLITMSIAYPDSAYPMPRDYAPRAARVAAGWGPTGADELVLWCALCLLAVAALASIFVNADVNSAEEDDTTKGPSETTPFKGSDAPPPSRWQQSLALTLATLFGSFGFTLGQPVSSVYAVFATLPLFLGHAWSRRQAPWPLERPFPSHGGDPWAMDKDMQKQHDAAWMRSENVKVRQSDGKHDSQDDGRGIAGEVRSLCRTVTVIQRAQPWREPSALETRLHTIVVDGLRRALEVRSMHMVRHMLDSAILIGYVAPPKDEDDDADASGPPPRRGWLCSMNYQRLTGGQANGGDQGRPSPRNEAWCADVHSSLVSALRLAAETARVLEDEPSSRWLGACLSFLHPGPVQGLASRLAQVADCLSENLGEEWERSELFRTVASAAGLQPTVHSGGGITAFDCGLRLPGGQRLGTLSWMLKQLPPPTPQFRCPNMPRTISAPVAMPITRSEAALAIVRGDPNHTLIDGNRVVICKSGTVGAPELRVPRVLGRWFFEVEIFGHASVPQHGPIGTPGKPSTIGWAHVDIDSPEFDAVGVGNSHSAFGGQYQKQLSPNGSYDIDALMTVLPGVVGTNLGCGIIGCALESTGETFKAWFALDGDWQRAGLEVDFDRSSGGGDLVESTNPFARTPVVWSGRGRLEPLIPCASGRLACAMSFSASSFVFGPPDESFRPLIEAAGGTSIEEPQSVTQASPRAQLYHDAGASLGVNTYGKGVTLHDADSV